MSLAAMKLNSGLHVKYPMFLSNITQIWIFYTDFHKSLQNQHLLKSAQWGAKLTDGRTHRHDEANNRLVQLTRKRLTVNIK
jgi:hypothetical protein